MEQAHKIFVIVFAAVIINSIAFVEAGISLGSVQVKKTATVNAGESTQFKLLFFNAHEIQGMYITTDYESPDGWVVSVNPSEFMLPYRAVGDKTNEEGFEILGTGSGDVKAKPVFVNVKVPQDEESGTYTIKIKVHTKKQGSGISMTQSRNYVFRVVVISQNTKTKKNKEEEHKASSQPKQSKNRREKMFLEPINPERGNAKGIVTSNTTETRNKLERDVDNVTGMLLTNPVVAPISICLVVIVFFVMRYFKRI